MLSFDPEKPSMRPSYERRLWRGRIAPPPHLGMPSESTTAFRLVHGEAICIPGLVV